MSSAPPEPPPNRWSVPPGWTLVYHEITGSTNDDARAAARVGARGRKVFLADEQSAGRGRYGRSWVAPASSCLLFSLLLKESLSPVDCTVVASVAVAETIAEETELPARIKWPNDVMIGQRKVCGILTEVVAFGDRMAIVVGIGLNVNLDLATAGLPATATSLAAELGRPVSRSLLFDLVLRRLDALLAIEPARLVPMVRARWESLLWRHSQLVRLSDGADVVEGTVEGLAASGALLLRLANGATREISTGELLLE